MFQDQKDSKQEEMLISNCIKYQCYFNLNDESLKNWKWKQMKSL